MIKVTRMIIALVTILKNDKDDNTDWYDDNETTKYDKTYVENLRTGSPNKCIVDLRAKNGSWLLTGTPPRAKIVDNLGDFKPEILGPNPDPVKFSLLL